MPASGLSGKCTILKAGESTPSQIYSIEWPINSMTNFGARRKKVQAKDDFGDTYD